MNYINSFKRIFAKTISWLKSLTIATLGLASISPSLAQTVNLKDYFPSYSQTVLGKVGSQEPHARYTFNKAPSGFLGLYNSFLNINKPGYHYTWQKEYLISGSWCTKTYGVLFFADDKSVTEVGDWTVDNHATGCYPNTVFGYRNATNKPTGLLWSGAGGLTKTPIVAEASVYRQNSPGAAYLSNGYQTYSKTGLIEIIPSMTIRGRVYENVAHIVMYHGTRSPTPQRVRCDIPPISAYGAYYQSYKDFNSYAIELWLAPGIGVIQEDTPFIEEGSYWGVTNCSGSLLSPNTSWRTQALPSYTR